MRFGVGSGPAGRRHLPDPRDRRRVRRVHRRRPRPEHRVRPDGDPRPGRRTALGGRRADPARPVVEGLGDRPRRAPRPDPPADVAEPDDPRRRRQQERRQVHPAPDGPLPGRAGAAAQRCRDHRGGDRRGRVVARGTAPSRSTPCWPPSPRPRSPWRRTTPRAEVGPRVTDRRRSERAAGHRAYHRGPTPAGAARRSFAPGGPR